MRRGAICIFVTAIAVAGLGLACALLALDPTYPVVAPAATAAIPAVSAVDPPSTLEVTPPAHDPATASAPSSAPQDAGCVIVSLKSTPTAAQRAALGLGATSRIRGDRLLLAAVPEGLTTSEFAARLADSAIVAYAEPDYLLTPAVAPYSGYPNDTYFRDETAWGFTELTGARTNIPHAKS